MLVPARPDSGSLAPPPESPPAPLLIPGRPGPDDASRKSPEERAREHFRIAEALEAQGQLGAAIISYDNALKLDPSLREANYRIGKLHLARDQVEAAVRHFAIEVGRHSDHVDAARELGLGLARLGDSTRSIILLERLTRERPRDDESWRALGFAYSAARRPGDAEAALRRAIRVPPRRAAEHRDLAVLLNSLGREREARTEYGRALELDPGDATVWYNLGNLDRRHGKNERALDSYRRATALDSEFTLAMKGEVEVLTDLGRREEAARVYRGWLDSHPGDHHIRLEAVRFLGSLGRGREAIEVARQGVAAEPRSADAHAVLGIALQSAGELREALREMREAESLVETTVSQEKLRELIDALRRSAPDSLREMFRADSAAHAEADPEGAERSPR